MVSNKAAVDKYVKKNDRAENDSSGTPDPQLSIQIPVAGNAHPAQSNGLLYQKKYSVPEAAKLMDIGQTNLRAIIKDGKIPVLRINNKKLLLLESDLEEFIHGNHVSLKEDDSRKPNGKLRPLPKDTEESDFMKKVRTA
jgi:excisionase family DNA binding protein